MSTKETVHGFAAHLGVIQGAAHCTGRREAGVQLRLALDCLLQNMQALLGHHDAADAAAQGGMSQIPKHRSAAPPI